MNAVLNKGGAVGAAPEVEVENSQSHFTRDAEIFLNALGPGEEFTFQTLPEGGRGSNRTPHGTWDQHREELARRNAEGAGVFVTVNRTDDKGRRSENITGVRAVFVDLDGPPLPWEWHLEPHFVIETSPKRYHVYWLVRDFPLERFSEVQKRLAQRYGGDPSVIDLARVMRLPGSWHRKGEPFRTRIVSLSNAPPYSPAEIVQGLPPPPSARPGVGHPSGGAAEVSEDPVYAALKDRGLILRKDKAEGRVFIHCPWKGEHTTPGNDTEAVYFPPHFNGHATPGFKCQHAHCADRTMSDLKRFLGLAGGDEDELRRLAGLSQLDYDRERTRAATKLGIRVSTLDAEVSRRRPPDTGDALQGKALSFEEPEPWPEPVAGAELLDVLRKLFRDHAVLPDHGPEALTLWTVFTYALEKTNFAPLLALVSPEKRCGKTTVLSLLSELVRRPLPAANLTSAATFRVIELSCPTLLIDEADSFLRENEELRGVLNSGHTEKTAFVLRTVGDDHKPRQFSTWGAKAIATIGTLPETLMDRAIVLPMRRKTATESVKRVRDIPPEEFIELRRKIVRWVEDQAEAIRTAKVDFPDALNDRARDNWELLFKMAAVAGGEWPERARTAALSLSAGQDIESEGAGVELLGDLREIIDGERREGRERILSADLVKTLCADETKRWATYNRGKPLDGRGLGRLLKPYGIKARQIRVEQATGRGYRFEDFEDAFSRYLPRSRPAADPRGELFSTGETAEDEEEAREERKGIQEETDGAPRGPRGMEYAFKVIRVPNPSFERPSRSATRNWGDEVEEEDARERVWREYEALGLPVDPPRASTDDLC